MNVSSALVSRAAGQLDAELEKWRERPLGGVQLIASDDHAGFRAARLAVFGGIPWRGRQFHLQQNAQAYVPHKEMQTEVADDPRTIFNAPDRTTPKPNCYL